MLCVALFFFDTSAI